MLDPIAIEVAQTTKTSQLFINTFKKDFFKIFNFFFKLFFEFLKNPKTAREIQCWSETLSLQNASTRLRGDYGENEKLYFLSFYTKTTGMVTDSLDDRIVESSLGTDGFVSINRHGITILHFLHTKVTSNNAIIA